MAGLAQHRMTAGLFALLLVVIGILVCCSALFSGLETALFALKPHQLQRLQDHHPALSRFIQIFRENPRRVLNVLLLGDGLVKVPLVVLCLFVLWRNPFAARVPQWLAATAIFALVVLLCDLIPKLLALSAPYRLSAIGAFTLQLSIPLLDRVGHGLETFSTALVDFVTPSHLHTRRRLSDEELETIVEIGEEEGALHEAEAEMIQEIIKLGDKTAKDCMTPRVDTFMLPDDLTNDEAIARLRPKRHRRVPVYADTPDQIVGILDVKNFLINPSDHYTEALIAPSFVPETMRALDLLKLFLSHAQGLAVVVDEFGGTEGIITTDDVVEEILSDAVPRGDVDLYIEPLENGKFLVSGNARLDDLSEHLGFNLEAEGIDTIGGFVFNRLGYLPPSGAQLELPRLVITVRRAGRKRIEEILLEKTTMADDGHEDAAENAHLGA
jgi:CBS domain containing-hemolysin-like protein